MPELLNQTLYDATYRATQKVIGDSKAKFTLYQKELLPGTALYRYSSKQHSDGTEAGARKNWTELIKDIGNRWTGSSGTGDGASGGLYMSLEAEKGLDTEFPELDHYQGKDEWRDETQINFRDFKGNREIRAQAQTLYYMFAFFLDRQLKGIDLTLNSEAIKDIHRETERITSSTNAKKTLNSNPSASELYLHSDDASFCRAIGNRCFQESNIEFILVSSTRNTNFNNVILKCSELKSIDYLQAFGRSSFYLDAEHHAKAEVTRADQVYNEGLTLG